MGCKAQRDRLQPMGLPSQVLFSNLSATPYPWVYWSEKADKSRMVIGEQGEDGGTQV